MADETRKEEEPVAPTPEADELSDEQLKKVSGGGAVIEDKVAAKPTSSVQLNASTLKSWGDPH